MTITDEPAVSDDRATTLDEAASKVEFLEQGYELGFARGKRDAGRALQTAVEAFARSRSLGGNDRALLRAFARFAEGQLTGTASTFAFVGDGLGI
jgi:hypothetical protein